MASAGPAGDVRVVAEVTTPNDKIRDVLKAWGQWSEFYGLPLLADEHLKQLAQLALITAQPAPSDDKQDNQGPRDKAWLASSPWDWDPSQCKGCGVVPGGVHADDCAYRQPARCSVHGDQETELVDPAYGPCGAKHPQLDVQCDAQHHPVSDWHRSSKHGVSWTDGQPLPVHLEPDEFVRLEPAAVRGLVDLLHAAGQRLNRVHAAYKGPAAKHTGDLAKDCHDTAGVLMKLAGDPDGPAVRLTGNEKEDGGDPRPDRADA